MMRHTLRSASGSVVLVVLVLILALGGCDLFGGGDTVVEGVVVNAATGEPLEAIGVALEIGTGSFGGYVTVADDLTNSDGRFRLRYDAGGDGDSIIFRANTNPYDPTYTDYLDGDIRPGRDYDLRIELEPEGE